MIGLGSNRVGPNRATPTGHVPVPRRTRWRALVVAVGLALGTAGCGNPCGSLADRTCEKVGEDAPLCKEARKRAETAGSAERATCERALRIHEAATAE